MDILVTGTCRVNKGWYHFDQINSQPNKFKNEKYTLYCRPFGYHCSSSELLQNIKLLKDKEEMENIKKNSKLYHEIFLTNDLSYPIAKFDYKIAIVEVCSLKVYKFKKYNYICPYKIDKYKELCINCEEESEETFRDNITNIRKELNDIPIILVPPILKFKHTQKRSAVPRHVVNYRQKISNFLKNMVDDKNYYFFDLNSLLDEKGLLINQYHFTEKGYNLINKELINLVESILKC